VTSKQAKEANTIFVGTSKVQNMVDKKSCNPAKLTSKSGLLGPNNIQQPQMLDGFLWK
jgi:hypothetical protein